MKGLLRIAGLLLVIAGAAIGARADSGLLGQQAPDFALKSLEGANLRLSEYTGQIVLLNFWATWSGPSRQELPALEKLHATYRSAGLVVLGINVDEDSHRAAEYVRTVKTTYPMLLDPRKAVAPAYQLSKLPMTLLIDRAGAVRYIHTDFKPGNERDYQQKVRELLNE